MKPLAVALVIALSLAASASARSTAAAGPAQKSSNTAAFTDPAGDSGAGPDVTTVTVSNDDAGLVTFRIQIPNRPDLASDMAVVVFVDADRNASTGWGPGGGSEYAIELGGGSVALAKWTGSDFDYNVPQTTLTGSYSAGTATMAVNRSELPPATDGFKFYVLALSGSVEAPEGDVAPDGDALWDYAIKVTVKPQLAAGAVKLTPRLPKAGGPLEAAMPVTVVRGAERTPLARGTVRCTAAISAKPVRARAIVVGGVALCSWNLPKTAKGKTLRATITVTFEGVTVSKSFSVRIR